MNPDPRCDTPADKDANSSKLDFTRFYFPRALSVTHGWLHGSVTSFRKKTCTHSATTSVKSPIDTYNINRCTSDKSLTVHRKGTILSHTGWLGTQTEINATLLIVQLQLLRQFAHFLAFASTNCIATMGTNGSHISESVTEVLSSQQHKQRE